ncbi:uroporphyrinogen decarboxylase family protein [Chloroflexota bacterium]
MDKSAGELYQERLKRVQDAIQLKVPDRVPTLMDFGCLPARYAGMIVEDIYYDPDKLVMANKRMITEFAPDMFFCPHFVSGVACEAVDTKLYKWPGHGAPPDHTLQFVEGEYMQADEYDALLEDPTDYIIRTYMPRAAGALSPFQKFPPLSELMNVCRVGGILSLFADPEIVAACKAMYEAGKETKKWDNARAAFTKEIRGLGFPAIVAAGGRAPFDHLSDHFRGMKGTMLDMYRQPEKLLAAIERLLPITIRTTVDMAKMSGENIIFMAPHRGADGFMSLKQFEKFYWPGLKTVILALIDAELTPYLFWEGEYTSRLEYLLELPEGKILNRFDRVDMIRVKEVLGGHQCISGGIMPSLLQTGTVQEVKDQCKMLIDVVGRDGGFIMTTSCAVDEAKPENVKAMIDFTREYGVYK